MRQRSIWKTLGVAQTLDRAEIRRAYARRLKETHPEDDPAGFQALREAYETALSQAENAVRWAAYRAEQEDLGDEEEVAPVTVLEPADASAEAGVATRVRHDPGGSETEAPIAPAPQPDPMESQRQADLARHSAILNRVGRLAGEGADEEALKAALAETFASPAMDYLSVHADTERWLARLVLSSAPNADALIDPLARHFQWRTAQRRWDLPGEVAATLERYEDYSLLERLKRGEHYHRHGYRALAQAPLSLPPVARMRLGRHADDVRKFLRFIETNHPGLEQALDPEALSWWKRHLGKWLVKSPGNARALVVSLGAIGFFVVVLIQAAILAPTSTPTSMRDDIPMITPGDPIGHLKARALRHPLDAANQVELCHAQARLGLELNEALDSCGMAVVLDRESLTAVEGRALSQARLREWEGAEADYGAILRFKPNDARALYGRGFARLGLGQEGGREDLVLAMALDPNVGETYAGYGLPPPPASELAGAKPPVLPGERPPQSQLPMPAGAKVERPAQVSSPRASDLQPLYPVAAQRAGAGGRVLLRCRVGVNGLLNACIVWSETPSDMGFGEAALKMAGFYRFTPMMVDGRPDPRGTVVIPFSFKGRDYEVAPSQETR